MKPPIESFLTVSAILFPVIFCALALSYRFRRGPVNWRVICCVPVLVLILLMPFMIAGFVVQAIIQGFVMGRESYDGIMDFLINGGD